MAVIEALTYAGHSAVFFHGAGMCVAIDPWLKGNPRCPEALQNPERLDLIVLSHGHSDHAGDAVRLAKKYKAAVAATYELAMILGSEGVPEQQLVPMNKGGSAAHQGVQITLTHAMHSSSYDGSKGTVYAGEPCGIVLNDGKRSIYHAGDTALFSDLSLIGKRYKPDIALLPIGDRFTMGPEEAAQAAKLLGCRRAIPIHYATFGMLTGTAAEFERHCKALDIEAVTLEPGQRYTLA